MIACKDLDTELMVGLRDGDSDAFRPLLERNYKRVVGLARRYGAEAAEDVAQETFMRVYQARERYRPERPFSSYLFRIATNHCVSRSRRRRPHLTEQGRVDPQVDDAEQPIETLVRQELKARVRSAVRRLPRRQQEAIQLRRFEGLSLQEVAERLSMSIPATKSLLHRARCSLKDMLGDLQPC